MSSSEISPGITSLSEALSRATAWIDGDDTAAAAAVVSDGAPPETNGQGTPVERAIDLLAKLQTRMSRDGLISKNEALDDVSTSTLELLGVEYHLGRAHLALPTNFPSPPPPPGNDAGSNGSRDVTSGGPSPSLLRKKNVTRAIEYYHAFMKRLEQMGEGMLEEATLKEYHSVLDSEDDDTVSDGGGGSRRSGGRMNPSRIREMKIQRFQRKKSAKQKQTQLLSQFERRTRLGIPDEEQMDGHDFESLTRTIHIETLRVYAEESLEEIQSSRGELEMLEMAIKMETARMNGAGGMDPRMMGPRDRGTIPTQLTNGAKISMPQQPLQMTQITQNPLTGELEYTQAQVSNGQLRPVQPTHAIQRQEIAGTVFRPGWNQPTMSLDELAERERADAIARSERQKVAEAEAMFKPRRYDQLERDGMEDNERLVEASAELDRKWDDWKEENPRGSGNKMSERGDRNF